MFRSQQFSKTLQTIIRKSNSNYTVFRQTSSSKSDGGSTYEYYTKVRSRNKIWGTVGLIGTVAAGYWIYSSNQETVPISGRERFNLVPVNLEKWLATWEQQNGTLPADHELSMLVNRIAKRLLKSTPYENLFDWKFQVINTDMVNAFASVGGKIYICTGILPYLQDEKGGIEEGLASVLGHEIGHAIARHVMERATMGTLLHSVLRYTVFPSRWLLESSVSVGLELPYSRMHEVEADFIGLQLLTNACYDPNAALRVEKRLEQLLTETEPPKYLNTHPPEAERVKNIEEWLPSALEKYNANCKGTSKFLKALHDFTGIHAK